MSGAPTAPQAPPPPQNPAQPVSPAPVVLSPAGVTRARRLLIFFSVLLALWIAAMIAMYARTVYPQRHPADGTSRRSVQ